MADVDFASYLRSILKDPRYCELCYVEPDAFLNLEEQTIKRKKSDSQEAKIEYFPVLKGLKKYALGQQRHHILLAGRPGSGKSTTLKRLLLEMASKALVDENRPIPVLVQLKGDGSIQHLIIAEFRRTGLRVTIEQIDDLLMDDKLLLLLDGVNEIPSDDLRRKLHNFREDNPTTPMIFTTRDLALGGDLGIEKQIKILPLKKPQIREFVLEYLPEYGDKLLRQLHDRLREIAETPLLLKMLCDVFDPVTQKIPKNKAELFLEFDQKYRKLKQYAPVYNDFQLFRSELLAHLAFVMIHGDPQKPTDAWLTISRHQAEIILEEWLTQRGMEDAPTKAKRWLEDLLEHDLLQVAADAEQIEFHHQLFQEFYAAKELQIMIQKIHPDLMDDKRLQHFYLNYLKWTEAVLIALSLIENESIVERVVQSALNVDLVFGLYLAGDIYENSSNLRLKTIIDNCKLQIPEFIKNKTYKSELCHDVYSKDVNTEECGQKFDFIRILKNDESSYEDLEMAIFELREHTNDSAVVGELYSVLDNPKYDERLQLIATNLLLELGLPISDARINKILTGNDEAEKATVIALMDSARYAWAIPQLLEMLSEDDYIINSAIIPFIIKTKAPLGLCCVSEYLLKLDSVYPELDDFDRFQANNRFLAYLLQDLGDDPYFIHKIVIPNLQNMCSQEYLLEAFEAVSDVNSCKSEQWTSTVELLAAIGYQPAIDILLYAIEYPNNYEVFYEGLNAVERLKLKDAIPYLISLLMQSYLLPSNHEKEMVVGVLANFKIPSTLPLISRVNAPKWGMIRSIKTRTANLAVLST
jgi:DNA polymerase III delta prime subunit